MDLDKGKERATEEYLFLERLQTLYDKNVAELQAFAQRETRSIEEVRQRIAEWHCKYLFDIPSDPHSSLRDKIVTILQSTSQALESLERIARLHSFFLVVNPSDPKDEGFLGGTMLGREWWRGQRGCGATGASAFKTYCNKSQDRQTQSTYTSTVWPSASHLQAYVPATSSTPGEKLTASALKTEIYSSIRTALRTASGHRTAEMKWTAHSKLDVYGVRLEGWPADVPMKNPSSMSAAQMQRVLGALRCGMLRFVPVAASAGAPALPAAPPDCAYDISWACQDDGDALREASVLQAEQAGVSRTLEAQAVASRESTPASPFVISAYASGTVSGGDEAQAPPKKRQREDT